MAISLSRPLYSTVGRSRLTFPSYGIRPNFRQKSIVDIHSMEMTPNSGIRPQSYFECVLSVFIQLFIADNLLQPWYAQAVARCLVSEYLLKYFPYEDFNIYEIGAGNGTLARDILDFLQAEYPAVYERTKYTIIEISEKLAGRQRQLLQPTHPCVNVVNKSIFRWRTKEPSPCFFVAMEVVVCWILSSGTRAATTDQHHHRTTSLTMLSGMTCKLWSRTKGSSA